MECSQSFSRSKLPELLQFSREASCGWTQCASWRRTLQNFGSRCLSTTTTDTFSTTDFGGTQTNFSRTNSLTLEDTPTPSISTRKTFRNCGNSSNSTTKSLKQLKMRSPSPKPMSNQTRGTLCLLAFTAGGNNLFEEVQTHPLGIAGERTCCQKCTVLQRVTPGLMATTTTRQWPCTGILTCLSSKKKRMSMYVHSVFRTFIELLYCVRSKNFTFPGSSSTKLAKVFSSLPRLTIQNG